MDFLLNADTPLEKLTVMVLAIALFVAVMAHPAVRRRPTPQRARTGWLPSRSSARRRCCSSSAWSDPRSSPPTSRSSTATAPSSSASTTSSSSSQRPTCDRCSSTRSPGCSSSRSPPPSSACCTRSSSTGRRFESIAKALVFLPLAISFVGASIIWKFVYDFRADIGVEPADRPAQPDPDLARHRAVPVPAQRTVEHLVPHHRLHLDPDRFRHDDPVGVDQGHPGRHHRGRAARRRERDRDVPLRHRARPSARPWSSCSRRSPSAASRSSTSSAP